MTLCLSRCVIFVVLLCVIGCQTMPKKNPHTNESQEEIVSALEKVTGGLSGPYGQPVDAKKLVHELRHDKEARSAIESISEGLAPQRRQVIRYCPETGEHFGPGVETCPETGTPLVEIVEEY